MTSSFTFKNYLNFHSSVYDWSIMWKLCLSIKMKPMKCIHTTWTVFCLFEKTVETGFSLFIYDQTFNEISVTLKWNKWMFVVVGGLANFPAFCYSKDVQINQLETELDQEKRMADNLVNDMVNVKYAHEPNILVCIVVHLGSCTFDCLLKEHRFWMPEMCWKISRRNQLEYVELDILKLTLIFVQLFFNYSDKIFWMYIMSWLILNAVYE